MNVSVFEKTYQDYLGQIAEIDLTRRATLLGAEMRGDGISILCMGEHYHVSASGIWNASGHQADFGICVVLCKYVLLCPPALPAIPSEWVTFKDFKDAQPLINYFNQNALGPITKYFSGKTAQLRQACFQLGGEIVRDGANYDLSVKLSPLPKVPLMLRFTDADEEFPAQSVLLFQKSTEAYLDMECVAILGTYLAEALTSFA